MKFNELVNKAIFEMKKNSPAILTGLGVTGVITTAVLAVRATPLALDKIAEEAERRAYEDLPVMNTMDTIKVVWKDYAPAVVMGGATIACIIGANTVNSKRNAALVGLYSITDNKMREYQSKVLEVVGEKKEGQIKEKIAEQHMMDKDVEEGNGIHRIYNVLEII